MHSSRLICSAVLSCVIASAVAQQEAALALHITASAPPAKALVFKVKHKDWVTLQVDSDAPGELHLHAYHLSWTLKANEAQTLRFEAKATGKFKMEWHAADTKAATPATGHSHTPPLASLEVMPR